jgi:2-keto-4-pentenoate hydratase/2-oxohepta-3-ene-1,7-dioic acid hydratase in catechol pathway
MVDSLAGPVEDIPIDTGCQAELDYEEELCVVIGKTCQNLNKSGKDPLDYMLGYTAENDVSARSWQVAKVLGG